MDRARAIGWGGRIIYADAVENDYSSYLNLGLRCPVCGEPVHFKKGYSRKPHFAHFKGTDPRQVEECKLRAAAYGNDAGNISSIEDGGQRLEIFQKHFLKMISIEENKIVDDSIFKKWIHLVTLTHNQVINNITKASTEYFITHRQPMEDKYILPRTEIKNRQILLQQEIALEAMSYLCVKSSRSLLEYILHYSIYKLHNQPQEYNLLIKINTKKNIQNICLLSAKIIIFNPWVEAFGKITTTDAIVNLKKTSISKMKTSVLFDWSMLVTVDLKDSDYLADKLGTIESVKFQLCLEANFILALYRISHRYLDLNENFNPTRLTKNQLNDLNAKVGIKLLDLATVELVDIDAFQWVATKPLYEHLAVEMNKAGKLSGKNLNNFTSKTSKQCNIIVLVDRVMIGDRVLCDRRYLGKKLLVSADLNNAFTTEEGHIKKGCEWLDTLKNEAVSKMLQANAMEIHKNVDLMKCDKSTHQRVHHMYKSFRTSCRKLVRLYFSGLSENDIKNRANIMLEYIVTKLGCDNRNLFLDLYHQVKENKVLVFNLMNSGVLNKAIALARKLYQDDTVAYKELDKLLFTQNYTPTMIEGWLSKKLSERK